MLRIHAQSEQQGIERDLHNPGGSESIALFSVGHAHNVNALRQTLEQGRDATAYLSPNASPDSATCSKILRLGIVAVGGTSQSRGAAAEVGI